MALADTIRGFMSLDSSQNAREILGDKKAKVIALCSQKGGVGKTTTTVNVGAALSEIYKKKVLLLDLDPQGHVEKSLGSLIPEGMEYTPLSTILMAKKPNLMDAIVKSEFELLHLTPGDKTLYEIEGAMSGKIGREFILSNILKVIRTYYDYILIDCPPNLGNLTLNALCAADYVMIPCEMSVLAFEGVTDLLETLDTVNDRLNKSLRALGVVFTRVDGRNVMMNELVEENLRNYFKGNVFKTQITVNTALNKAQLDGRPIFDYAPTSSGAANYASLTAEMLQKIKKMES